MRFQKIHVVINPASGKNEPILNVINAVLHPYGVHWDVSITHKAGDGARQAKAACEEGCDLIMAYGGDGTQVDVAEGLIGRNVPMAILPGGTANALADELGLPMTLEAALRVAVADDVQIRPIDMGKAGERYFLLRVGTGMIATFSEIVTREMKDRFGIAAYIIGGIQALSAPQFVKYQITVDGEVHDTAGVACLITNGNAIGALGIRLSKYVLIDDGLLDVFIVNNDLQTILGIAGSIAQIDNLALSLEHWQGRKITIQAEPSQGIYGDGEEIPFAQTPTEIEVLQGALQVLVPAKVGGNGE